MSQKTATRTVLRSDEFTCPSCVENIESRLDRIDGIEKSRVHFTTGRIEVDHDPAKATVDDLVEAVKDAGYRAEPRAF